MKSILQSGNGRATFDSALITTLVCLETFITLQMYRYYGLSVSVVGFEIENKVGEVWTCFVTLAFQVSLSSYNWSSTAKRKEQFPLCYCCCHFVYFPLIFLFVFLWQCGVGHLCSSIRKAYSWFWTQGLSLTRLRGPYVVLGIELGSAVWKTSAFWPIGVCLWH